MPLFHRKPDVAPADDLLGTGSGAIRSKHGQRIDLDASCAGDGLGDPSYCQTHLADWQHGEQRCEAAHTWRSRR